MEAILAHLIGDYVVQTDRMANRKGGNFSMALTHAVTYGMCFCFMSLIGNLPLSLLALLVIVITHALLDCYNGAKYVVWFKNYAHEWVNKIMTREAIDPRFYLSNVASTGYPADCPAWLSVLLKIIADNTIHLFINYLALTYLVR